MRTATTILGLLFLTPLLGCPPTDDKTDTDEADADADTDADTDADVVHHEPNAAIAVDDGDMALDYTIQVTGTATLTDKKGEYTGLAGALTYTNAIEGTTACDFDVDLVGTPYTGTCEGCDFAFDIVGTVGRDESTEDCYPYGLMSFVPDGVYDDFVLTHSASYVTDYGSYDDALLAGGSYYYYYTGTTYPGPYFNFLSYAGASFGTFTQTDNQIDWTSSLDGFYTDLSAYIQDCGGVDDPYYAYDPIVGSGGNGEINCEGSVTDVWTFEVVEGGTASISVDTIAADSAFDPIFYLNGPDGCLIGAADDAFDCTFPPLDYGCPAAIYEDLAAGTYEVVVRAWGSCTGETAAYDFQVDVTSPA